MASAPTVAANLLRPLLLAWAARLAVGGGAGSLPETVIASGLLVGEADEVAERVCGARAASRPARRESGEWAALLLERRR